MGANRREAALQRGVDRRRLVRAVAARRSLGARKGAVGSVAATRVVVDNSKGADAQFAAAIEAALASAGFEVEYRPPSPSARFDTAVHFVVEGVAVRVPEQCAPRDLEQVNRAIQVAAEHRSGRRRFRAVPVYRGETSRVLEWVDVFGAEPA